MTLYESHSEDETKEIARNFASTLKAGDIIAMQGTLGMGKSVFARELIRTLSKNPELEVPSPTFTLVQIYDIEPTPIWHYDLYRIENPDEIWELGWEEGLDNAINIIEWPENLGNLLPKNHIRIAIKSGSSQNHRIVNIES